MILRRGAMLPPICLISGEPTERRQKMVFRWQNQWLLYLLVFLSCIPPTMFVALPVLICLILFRVIRKVEIEVGLTQESSQRWKRRRRLWLIPPLFFVVGMVALVSFGSYAEKQRSDSFVYLDVVRAFGVMFGAMIMFVGLPLSVVAITRWIQNSFGLSLKQIAADYYAMEGVNRAVLHKLPEWQIPSVHANDQA